jgi:hypothetical protein
MIFFQASRVAVAAGCIMCGAMSRFWRQDIFGGRHNNLLLKWPGPGPWDAVLQAATTPGFSSSCMSDSSFCSRRSRAGGQMEVF